MSQVNGHRIARHVRNRALMGSAAPATLKPEPHKIWRATISHQELSEAGFNEPEADGWAIIKGLLKLKGIPAHFLEDGAPFKCDEADDGLVLEFG